MGLYRTDYIVCGWKLPKEIEGFDYWDDKNLPYVEGHKGVEYTIVLDDDYLVFGKLIAISSEWNFNVLNFDNLNTEEIKEKYREIFNVDGGVSEPYVFIFSHYS